MTQTAFIMAGPPGAGKTTWLKRHAPPGTAIASADHYHTHPDGSYHFRIEDIQKAHNACLRTFVSALQTGSTVACDNTNTRLIEIAPYLRLAEAFNYQPRIILLDAPLRVLIERNVHSVPPEQIRIMQERLHGALQVWPRNWPEPEGIPYGST